MTVSPSAPISPEEAGRRLRSARNILLVMTSPSLAEALCATPVIGNLRAALPDARIRFLAGPVAADAVRDHPDLDEVAVLPRPGVLAGFRRGSLFRRLRRDPADVALHLSLAPPGARDLAMIRGLRPGFISGLTDVPPGADRAEESVDCPVPLPEEPRAHVVDFHLSLLEGLGIPVHERHHRLAVTGDQLRRGGEILRSVGLDPERPILGAQVGGAPKSPERRWPPSHYATVLQRASLELGWQTLLLGNRDDLPALDAVQALGKAPIPRLTELPFPDYKAVLARLGFFITHDGDPIHVAAGVGVRSFFMFLSSPAWKWAPYGSHVSVWEETRPPGPSEAWSRMKPLLESAAPSTPG